MRFLILLWMIGLISKVSSHFDATKCGSSKECIYVPAGCEKNNVCKNIFSYKALDDNLVEMELFSTEYIAGTNYLAVGFSKDDLMGDDPVTQCVFPDHDPSEARLSYNYGKSNQPIQDPDERELEKTQVELIHSHRDENSIYCQIRQKISAGPSALFPNLDQDHRLFLVRGKARKPDVLGIHSLDPSSPDFPFISNAKHNLARRDLHNEVMTEINGTVIRNDIETVHGESSQSFVTPSVSFWMKGIHGILMLIAWMIFVPMAVFSARYFRDHWPGSAPRGLKWWFHLHRSFNLIALLLMLVSILLIVWAAEWTWTGPKIGQSLGDKWDVPIHSLIGTIAVAVAVLNPLMALFRCAPDTGARPIFNWTHRMLGIIGFIAAMIAIGVAAYYFDDQWTNWLWAFSLFLLFIFLLIACILLFEILEWLKTRTNHKVHQLEMRGRGNYNENGRIITYTKVLHQRPMHATTILWFIFTILATAIAITLSIMLIMKR